MSNEPVYPPLPSRPDLPAIERRILGLWEERGTFERSVADRPEFNEDGSNNEFVFYDGPPFANGLPHYGHLLTGYVKDVIPRYQTMRGHRVERRFGWDCHGLPAEMHAEKELGVSGRAAITDYGIANFNDACRTSVLRYTKEWERYVTRQARWVDFENDYKTMDDSYMESVIWAFKQLWDRGLIYEAYRVMPYSWGAETPLSNFEIRLDDAMRPRQDPALTVAFELDPRPGDPGRLLALAWTTTPWTLPANLALAVGADIDYDLVEVSTALDGSEGPVVYVIGSAARAKYERELGEGTVVATVKGAELLERTYQPLLPYFEGHHRAFRIVAADYVSTEDGTGIVHTAPGHGEDDQRTGDAAGIILVSPVDDAGNYTAEVTDHAGRNVFEAQPDIIKSLKDRGLVLRHETYDHNYPHCWRTDTPIIYKAVSSWYVEVTAIRDRLVELNRGINWIPAHVRDGQFGKWLEGARDWSISRNRFWGSPIPVWRSDDPAHPRVDVYGSLDEIERDFGVRPASLHRPDVDDLVRPNPDDPTGRSMMRRVTEVFDCWFESGSMPFAQVHYPFENKEWFDSHSPADFIVEYIAQTRGWFYTMHVLSGALFDRPAFDNVICHGVVLDAEGRKLSKKIRNYPDPEEVFESQGSDALRWFLMSSPILRGGDLRISHDGAEITEVVRRVVIPIWNAASFLTTYANVDGYRPKVRTDSPELLDRYLLAKTAALRDAVTDRFDAYDIAGVCNEVVAYLDALNNWYIRRSRDRFWAPAGGSDAVSAEGKANAYDTLHTVLCSLMRITAPLLPFLAEEIYRNLTGEESVHLVDWPTEGELPADPELVRAMDEVRALCSTVLGLREDRRLRVRLPLSRLTVAGPTAARLEPYFGLVADEVNVKSVVAEADAAAHGTFVLRPNGRVLGPRLGGDVQKVLKAAKAGDWERSGDGVLVAGHLLTGDDFELGLQPNEGEAAAAVRLLDPEGFTMDLGLVAALDVEVTPELAAEGMARDVVRLIQQTRKDLDLNVTDRITVTVAVAEGAEGEAVAAAVDTHRSWITEQTLAVALTVQSGTDPAASGTTGKVEGAAVGVTVDVA